jgi:hypothetical protein
MHVYACSPPVDTPPPLSHHAFDIAPVQSWHNGPPAYAPHLTICGNQPSAHHKVKDLTEQPLAVLVSVVVQDLLGVLGVRHNHKRLGTKAAAARSTQHSTA